MNIDKDKKTNTTADSNSTLNPEYYSKSERAIIMMLKVIAAILLFPLTVFIAAVQCDPDEDEDDSSDEPRRDDPFGDFSMSLNGWD